VNVHDDMYTHDEQSVDSIVQMNLLLIAFQMCQKSLDQAFCILKVQSGTKPKPIRFKTDTGSQVNILPKRVFDALKLSEDHNVHIIPSNANLTA
jgi:hypothetical protein